MNETSQNSHLAGRGLHVGVALLGALVVAAGGYSIWLGSQTRDLRAQFATEQADNAALRSKLADTGTQLQAALDSLRDDMAKAEAETNASLAKAQSTAMKHADVAAAQLAKRSAAEARELSEQLSKMRDSANETSNRLDGITSDVGTVKTDVATAKVAIDDTRSDLQRARGDMGVMSGLIATNGKQIQELRDLGDRNIFEFTLRKDGHMQKVGDIQLMLKKADSGHNRFSVDVLADDKRVEKKDRGINEPVQFYTGRARQPYEIVVNEVDKNQVKGYLATPKVTLARASQPVQ